jgi:acetylornithine deacetylase
MERIDAAIDERRLVETLRDLVKLSSENPFGETPSQGQGEAAVAEYLGGRFENLGMARELREVAEGRFNVLGRLGPPSATSSLMLAGHMDTVRTTGYPEAYSAEVRDGRVFGRGACDMKGAIACYLEGAEVLREVGVSLSGALYVVGVADEEYAMIGAREIGDNGPRVDGVIVGEPTELRICPASKGRVSTFVVTRGRAAHSSMPENGVNAISHMGRVLGALERYSEDLLGRTPHPQLGAPRVTPGVISGGVQVNMVPDECRLEIDRRTLPGETKDTVYAELEAVMARVGAETPDFRADLTEPSWLVPPNETSAEHPLVSALEAGAHGDGGGEPGVSGFAAGSDAAYYGSPAVICGPGSIAQAHTTDEYVSVSELVAATRLYLRTALALLGEPNANDERKGGP